RPDVPERGALGGEHARNRTRYQDPVEEGLYRPAGRDRRRRPRPRVRYSTDNYLRPHSRPKLPQELQAHRGYEERKEERLPFAAPVSSQTARIASSVPALRSSRLRPEARIPTRAVSQPVSGRGT